MAVKTDDEMIEYVSILAKLELKGDEKERARRDMEKMIDYVDKLSELDTDGIDPLVQVIDTENVFREDMVTNSDDRDNILANAPEKEQGQFKVPKTFN